MEMEQERVKNSKVKKRKHGFKGIWVLKLYHIDDILISISMGGLLTSLTKRKRVSEMEADTGTVRFVVMIFQKIHAQSFAIHQNTHTKGTDFTKRAFSHSVCTLLY